MRHINMNKGFEAMIANPKPYQPEKNSYILDQNLKFSLFRREFHLSFQIKSKK